MDGAAHNIPEATTKPRRTYHRQLGRYEPLRFGPRSWYRFRDDRTAIYLRQVGGDPTDEQRGLIADMIEAEWQAKKLAKEVALNETTKEQHSRERLVADNRRTLFLLRRDLRMTMRKPPTPASTKQQPTSLPDIVAEMLSSSKALTPSAQAVEQPGAQPDLFDDGGE